MKNIFVQNKAFFIPMAVLWFGIALILIVLEKAQIHLFINQYHTPFFDNVFKYGTYLGDGYAPLILGVALLFVSYRKSFLIGLSGVFAGIFAQSLKRLAFPDMVRPKKYFAEIADLYFVPGVDVHSNHSFPSGHTATAFALFLGLAVFSKNKAVKVLCFILALMVAFSRVYISQHFLIDVWFGAIIGCLGFVLAHLLLSNSHKKWLDNSILRFNKK